MIVVDASAIVELLLRRSDAAAVERRLFLAGDAAHAPHLIDVEIVHVVRRLAAVGEISAERGGEVIADLADLPVRRYPHTWMIQEAWRLRANITAYDAMYVALAKALDAPLLTRDRRLAAAARSMIAVEVL